MRHLGLAIRTTVWSQTQAQEKQQKPLGTSLAIALHTDATEPLVMLKNTQHRKPSAYHNNLSANWTSLESKACVIWP
jgi:hypothetical protein